MRPLPFLIVQLIVHDHYDQDDPPSGLDSLGSYKDLRAARRIPSGDATHGSPRRGYHLELISKKVEKSSIIQ